VLLLAGLSTSHKIGLAIVAAIFICFALASAFLAPRRWPDFPGKQGMSVYIIACLVCFVGMMSAVYFFGKEAPEAEASSQAPAAQTQQIQVTESEWKVQLPTTGTLKEGTYTFLVKNAGQIPHDLAIQGTNDKTPLIKPGGTATLKVSLKTGTYTLYCTVAGHKALGMVAKLAVG
jgi:plastocyanin